MKDSQLSLKTSLLKIISKRRIRIEDIIFTSYRKYTSIMLRKNYTYHSRHVATHRNFPIFPSICTVNCLFIGSLKKIWPAQTYSINSQQNTVTETPKQNHFPEKHCCSICKKKIIYYYDWNSSSLIFQTTILSTSDVAKPDNKITTEGQLRPTQ